MIASILNIGNEILSGLTINTNASYIAQNLDNIGVYVNRINIVSDDELEINLAINKLLTNCELLIITGGLGPTNDDITKTTLSNFFNVGLRFDIDTYENIKNLFSQRNIEITETNRNQAMVPENCLVLKNRLGTAPGMWFNVDDKIIISLPGVPFEMKNLIDFEVIPQLKKIITKSFIKRKIFHTIGIPESFLHDRLQDFEKLLPKNFQLAYLPEPGMVKLRLTIFGDDEKELNDKLFEQEIKLRNILKDDIFGTEQETLPIILSNLLKQKNKTIATAESCTGGYLSHLITSISGSSEFYKGSIIAYSNEIKNKILDINKEIIDKYGAVSKEVAYEMAKNIKNIFNTDYSISITGIAGPNGGTKEKPVGTVFVGIATPQQIITKKYILFANRSRNIHISSLFALNELRLILNNLL